MFIIEYKGQKLINKVHPKAIVRQTIIEPETDSIGSSLKELWTFRELLLILSEREVSLRYRQTFLGVTWVVIQPLLTSVIFTIIFGKLMKAPSDNVAYEIFTFAGLLSWNLFSQSLQRAGISLTKDIRLITKIFFPRIIIPLASTLSTLIDFAVSLIILFILMPFYKTPFLLNLLIIPILLVFNVLLAAGVGIIFASLNVYYRDFTYVLPFVVQIWMYASPLAYSAKLIPQNWSWVYNINPIVGIINGFRWAVFGNSAFPTSSLIYSAISSIVIFFVSLVIFNRLERSFADVI